MNLKNFIIEKSKQLNIDLIRFTDNIPLYNIETYLKNRLESGLQTEFEDEDIQKRIDPKLTLPGCKSIIVVAMSYNVDYHKKPEDGILGTLSKSTWGMDYHKVLKNKIDELILEIETVIDFNYKAYVDTGPLIERELAYKSGIGYYGKNCSIINEDWGSFIFLGYIMTDLIIQSDEDKKESQCGECDLCIKACPTNALEAYKLNPKKCVSYLTQTKNKIPLEYREKMGNKIYGCDTCQVVCPKNKQVKMSTHDEFIPYFTNGNVDIIELIHMSNREFKNKYGSMAGSWRGKNVLKRNVIIALGNMKDKDNAHILKEIRLEKNDFMIDYIDWALENIFLTK